MGTNPFLVDFRQRLQRISNDWIVKNNSSLDWNSWARANPREARDMCLEADYFFGSSNVLHKDWSSIVAKWGNIPSPVGGDVRGDAKLDDGSYQPVIFDEPETGPRHSDQSEILEIF